MPDEQMAAGARTGGGGKGGFGGEAAIWRWRRRFWRRSAAGGVPGPRPVDKAARRRAVRTHARGSAAKEESTAGPVLANRPVVPANVPTGDLASRADLVFDVSQRVDSPQDGARLRVARSAGPMISRKLFRVVKADLTTAPAWGRC